MNPTNPSSLFRREWPTALVVLLPFVVFVIIWPSLPAQVPMHVDSHGIVNRYGIPIELLILPGINLLVAILLYFIPRIDPKQANIAASLPAYRWIRFAIAAFLTCVFGRMLATTLNPTFDAMPFIGIGLLVLFCMLGFLMPKLKQNYLIGIRLPWTLDSEENWRRTHAFAGKWWVRGSLLGIVLSLVFQSISFFIAFGTLIVLVISTVIYSYRLFRRETQHVS
ncbi:MAG: SdpI family protein [Bacteroidota bacterium]|nr:SdpI family protein [Bacteroidota bacterium]MDP4233427.1 SdpI family protein [Bacteroidota bacterium]MDP4242293.1 SdpI family protein [Bacteroidota bacterium]MDP4287049.1 SdpI family protein [Bacteroidota bacterium]